MKRLLDQFRPLRAPDDGGGAGAGAGAAAGSDPAGGGGAAAGAAAAQKDGSNGAAAAADPAAAAANGPYRPEGLADQFFGKDDRETIDKLFAANKGYRDRDASRDVPQDAAGYLSLEGLKDFALDDTVKPYFEQLKDDPAAKAMFDAAKAHGMDRGAVLDVWQKGMKAMAEAGILEPLVDAKAERALLLPEAAKQLSQDAQDRAIDARMQKNEDFVKLMVTQGLDQKTADHALLMLMDTAAGNQFLEFFQSQVTGAGRAQPLAGNGSGANAGGDQRAQLKTRMAEMEAKRGTRDFDLAAYDQLMADYKKVIGS